MKCPQLECLGTCTCEIDSKVVTAYCIWRGDQKVQEPFWPCSLYKSLFLHCKWSIVQPWVDFCPPLGELVAVTLLHCQVARLLLGVWIVTYKVGWIFVKKRIQRFGRLGSHYCSSESSVCQLALVTVDSLPRLAARSHSAVSTVMYMFFSHRLEAPVLNVSCVEFVAFTFRHVDQVTWHNKNPLLDTLVVQIAPKRVQAWNNTCVEAPSSAWGCDWLSLFFLLVRRLVFSIFFPSVFWVFEFEMARVTVWALMVWGTNALHVGETKKNAREKHCAVRLHTSRLWACVRSWIARANSFIKAKERFVVSVAASSPHGVICPPRSQSKRLSCTCLLAGVYHKFLLP